MGKPHEVKPAQVETSYNWGDFGSANQNAVDLNATARQSLNAAQGGISQYVNELLNPSYTSESFRARQALIDASNRQYANQLGANAVARGARGSATQNILNSIAANRNNQMRQAMTEEDARVRNIINSLMGIEGNYFNQTNTMANNILSRVNANVGNQQQANLLNTQAQNQYENNLMNAGVGLAATMVGGPLAGALASSALQNSGVYDVNGNYMGQTGGYGTYQPY